MLVGKLGEHLFVESIAIQLGNCNSTICNRGYSCYIKLAGLPENLSFLINIANLLLNGKGKLHCRELILSLPQPVSKSVVLGLSDTILNASFEPTIVTLAAHTLQDACTFRGFLKRLWEERSLLFPYHDNWINKMHLTVSKRCLNYSSDTFDYLYRFQSHTQLLGEKRVSKQKNEWLPPVFPTPVPLSIAWKTYKVADKPVISDEKLIEFKAEYDREKKRQGENIILDRCVRHAFREVPCKAGSRSFHIWPSGNVTGCPYQSFRPSWSFPPPPETEEELIKQIEALMQSPDCFEYCPANPFNDYKAWKLAEIEEISPSSSLVGGEDKSRENNRS